MSAPAVDVDAARELLDSLAPQCEVLDVHISAGISAPPERCEDTARWAVRLQCQCGTAGIDLMCDRHVGFCLALLIRCTVCGWIGWPVAREVEPL